jgi:hypothetical protein
MAREALDAAATPAGRTSSLPGVVGPSVAAAR